MKFQFKYLFLIFILLLGSSCNNTNYKKVDNLETSRKNINTVNFSINDKFNTSQINCILIGKFIDRTDISKFKDLNKAEIIRKAIYGLVSVKNYDLIKISEIDKNIETLSNQNLLKYYNCDAIITGEILKFQNNDFISYSNTTVELILNLTDKRDEILWSSHYSGSNSDGSIPFSPVSLITGIFQVALNDKNETALQVVDMVTRKIIVSLPEKEIILKNQFASIEQNKGNFININQDIKRLFDNEEYEKASLALSKKISLDENNPVNYFLASKSYFLQGNYERSIHFGLEASSKGMNTSDNFSILGVSYLKLNNLKLSYASFFKALNLETNSSITNFNYALINEILNYDVVAAEHYYLSGLASIKEENYTRIYKSLVSLQRLSNKNKNIYETYVKLNNKILIFLNNRN